MADFPKFSPEFIRQQRTEHAAWMLVMSELRKRGVGNINTGSKDYSLGLVIVAWGEELCELRRLDDNPEHAKNALAEKRHMIDQYDPDAR